jgi:multidrug efflux pump
MVAILLSGILAYQLLSVSALPEIDYPTIKVTAFFPGASPEVMATSVTAPLERQFGQMPGLNQMTSTSSNGAVVITLQFTLTTSLDVAEQEVQQAINAASTYLPAGLPNPPIYSKVNPADTPIMTLALTSDTLPLPKVEDFADTRLAQKISQLSGVGLVSISGGQRPAVRVQVNPMALAAYGLTLEDVRAAIATGNVNTPKGSFDGHRLSYIINTNDQLLSAKEYRPLIIAFNNGAPIRVSNVATVSDSAENVNQAAWMNTVPAVILNIQRQPGTNVISVANRIKQLLPKLQNFLPKAIHVAILSDRTITIRASVIDAQFELILAVALVVMVIFLFLRKFSAMIIPGVTVPLSIIGTFGVMYLLGFSLNNLTLMALTIATGFAVDDAIVMIENISRYIEHGDRPLDAALKGAGQIGFTILSLSISLIAVLIPLLFMSDVVGRLFREFALTLAITILISALVSLTLTPMMCSRLLRPNKPKQASRFERKASGIQDRMIEHYDHSLRWVLNHRLLAYAIVLITLTVTAILLYIIPKGLFPIQDTGLILGISEAPQSISFAAMSQRQQALARIILEDPAVENLSSFIGIDDTNATLNSGRMLILLKPLDKRDAGANAIIHRLENKFAKMPGIKLNMQPVQDLTINDRISKGQYQYSVSSVDQSQVAKWTKLLVDKLRQSPKLHNVESDQQNDGLLTSVTIDRDTASRLGLTVQTIDNILYDAFGQRQVSIMFTQLNQYRVVLEVLPQLQQFPSALNDIYLNSLVNNSVPIINGTNPTVGQSVISQVSGTAVAATGSIVTVTSSPSVGPTTAIKGTVPLRVITSVSQGKAPLLITRQGQFPVAIISFNLAPGATLTDAVNAIDQAKKELNFPATVQTSFEGTAKIFQSSLQNEGLLVMAAIVVVYIVLGVLYESYIHPLTILSTLPSACMGALIALLLTGSELSVIALIGIILLIGIVMKNAIMMIDFALDLERSSNKSPDDAIFEAALLRFRPILMTTIASMLSAVPLAFGSGIGSELRRPLGIAIIGGLIVSQLLTLYTTPMVYLMFDRLAAHSRKLRARWFGSPSAPTPELP